VISIVCAIAGICVYSVLTYVLVAPRITIPISIIISILIFGLTRYYTASHVDVTDTQDRNSARRDNPDDHIKRNEEKRKSVPISTSLFVIIFTMLILICIFTPKQNFHIFVNWSEIGILGIAQLCAAIMLCFYVPGFGIVLIITKKYKMNSILTVLLAYLFSMVITGLTAFVAALFFDSAISASQNLFISVYVCILVTFLILNSAYKIRNLNKVQIKYPSTKYPSYTHFVSTILNKFWKYLTMRVSELLVFGSLLMLLVISSYYLYDGTTIGDQWYHQGRALLFMTGSFRDAALSGAEYSYAPLQSALLAGVTTLSGVPLVNAYASIAFLNMTAVFAFYYFFSTWVPRSMQKAALLACALFTLSAGFGWIYLLNISVTTQPILSEQSSLDTMENIRQIDILRTSNFVITAPATALFYIVLPIGFVLLGILRTRFNGNFTSTVIVTAISILGIMSHDEIYFFIIIACLLPLIFKIKARNYLYLGFLLALTIVYVIDIVTPGKFFTFTQILGLPLILLNVLFVAITWTIYLAGNYLYRVLKQRLHFLKALRKLRYRNNKFKFVTVVLVVYLIAYVYLLSFIVLSQLPLDTIKVQNYDRQLTWYLYPIRMGLAGLLGLAFMLSYLFKRFDKEIFVFGILIIISLLAGPYYDENRFSKYIMIGAIGFASLMVYKILTPRFNNKPAYTGVLISAVMITSSLSMLMFIGFNSLILQTQDFSDTLPRRHFPSMSELHLFEIIHNKTDVDSKKYNVISFSNEYDNWEDGLILKTQGFSGIPYDKLFQSPLTLNSSTLDTLYRQLDYTGARYIILPKDSMQSRSGVTEPTRFAFDYFKPIYEDSNYTVLEVPPLKAPTSNKTEVALLYNQKLDLAPAEVSNISLLPYNNNTFDFKGKRDSVTIHQNNQTKGGIILNSKNEDGDILWSKTLVPATKVNYLETRFRIASQNENKSNSVNLKWLEKDTEYSASLSGKSLDLYQKSVNSKDKKILVRNTEVGKNDQMWYVLKIVSLDNSIKIYINDALVIQAPRLQAGNNTEGISRVGIESNYNVAEFEPIKIGSTNDSSQKIYEATKYYDYYYPLSLLALSNTTYDIFSDDDLSAFSNRVILTSDNLKLDNVTLNKYIEYVRTGGKLIVINSNNNFNGSFSQLFAIQSNDSNREAFTNIAWHKNRQNALLNVPGLVNKIEMKSYPDTNVLASYQNKNNQTIAPFVIEKNFSNGGKIVLINSEGYFNTISNLPRKYFLSLPNISNLLDLPSTKAKAYQATIDPLQGFIGDITVSGNITLNSSSLSLLDEAGHPYVINASRIGIFNGTNNLHNVFDDVLIRDLKLLGDYEVIINFKGKLKLPDLTSNHNYISMLIPTDSNMTVKLSPAKHSYSEIAIQNHGSNYSIKVNNDSKIEFYKIRTDPPLKFVPIKMKNPEMKVNGNASIKNSVFNGYISLEGKLQTGYPIDLQGKLKAKFDFIDYYNKHYREGAEIKYITYLQSLTMDRGNIYQPKEFLRLPGDISTQAKEEGKDIPLEKVLSSSTNIFVLIGLTTITLFAIWLLRRMHVLTIT
jgi:hypothetical protein